MNAGVATARPSVSEAVRRFLVEPSAPEVALEFSSIGIVGARVETERGRSTLRAIAFEPLSEGALTPALEGSGLLRKEEIRDAMKRVLSRIAATAGMRAALVVPDIAARFRLFAAEEIEGEEKNRESVVAFRMRKLLPFAAAETRVVSAWPKSTGGSTLAIGMSTTVLAGYEQVVTAFGLDLGLIETSSMALSRRAPAQGDVFLIRHDPTWLALTLMRNGWPVSIRLFDSAIARNPAEIRREIASTAVFWGDRLGGTLLSDAWIQAQDANFEMLALSVREVFGAAAQRPALPPSFSVPGVPQSVERVAAPALFLLARD